MLDLDGSQLWLHSGSADPAALAERTARREARVLSRGEDGEPALWVELAGRTDETRAHAAGADPLPNAAEP